MLCEAPLGGLCIDSVSSALDHSHPDQAWILGEITCSCRPNEHGHLSNLLRRAF